MLRNALFYIRLRLPRAGGAASAPRLGRDYEMPSLGLRRAWAAPGPGPRLGRAWAATRKCPALPALTAPGAAWAPRGALPGRGAERRLALLRGRPARCGAAHQATTGRPRARVARAFCLFEYSYAI